MKWKLNEKSKYKQISSLPQQNNAVGLSDRIFLIRNRKLKVNHYINKNQILLILNL